MLSFGLRRFRVVIIRLSRLSMRSCISLSSSNMRSNFVITVPSNLANSVSFGIVHLLFW